MEVGVEVEERGARLGSTLLAGGMGNMCTIGPNLEKQRRIRLTRPSLSYTHGRRRALERLRVTLPPMRVKGQVSWTRTYTRARRPSQQKQNVSTITDYWVLLSSWRVGVMNAFPVG